MRVEICKKLVRIATKEDLDQAVSPEAVWPRGYKTRVQSQTQNKLNDWLLADTCPQAANHWALF